MKKVFLYSLVAISMVAMSCNGTKKAVVDTAKEMESFRNAPPAPGPAPKIEMGKFEKFDLANGLQVIVVENHKLPRVSYQVYFDEPVISEGENAGYISFTGQLLNKGTATKAKSEIDEAVDYMGASLNTSQGGVFGSALSKHKTGLLEIMSDVLMNPTFPEKEFDKLKTQTISGLQSNKNDPNAISSNVSAVVNFGKDHPYGQIETEKSVNSITLDMVKDYYKNYLIPNNSYLVIVGDVTMDEARRDAEKYFGAWKKGQKTIAENKIVTGPKEAKVVFVDKPGAVQSIINVTYPVEFTPGNPDAIPASLANSLLGGYFGSRLNQNLREDKAYTYGVRSSLRTDRMMGRFGAGGAVRNEVTDSSLVEMIKEMNTVRVEDITAEELETIKNVRSGNFARGLESPQTVARYALNIARYNLPADYYETFLEKVAAVSVEDIKAMANKYITPDNAYYIIVGNKDEVADKLVQFDTDGEIDFYDAFGNKLENQDTAIPDGVTAKTVIEDYINAIGGMAKLNTVKSISADFKATTQFGEIGMTTVKAGGNKVYISQSMGGNVMGAQIYNNGKGVSQQMGQSTPMDEKALEGMKWEAALFAETAYLQADSPYTLELKSIEKVDGKKMYKIMMTDPTGKKYTEFYDMTTGLKHSAISTETMGEQSVTTTVTYGDYKEVSGIQYPHKMSIEGAMPFALNLEATKVAFNEAIDDTMFKVD